MLLFKNIAHTDNNADFHQAGEYQPF